ncbi:MAG: ABC transporter substrate-binding protein [Rhodospirillaceae bacterium]
MHGKFVGIFVRSLLGLILLGAGPVAAETVRVGFIPVAAVGQLFVIEGEGWAAAAGLDLKLTQFESGPAMISALASGTLDAFYGGIGGLMVASGRGIDVKVVAACAIGEMAMVSRGLLSKLVGDGDLITGLQAFQAKTGRRARIASQPAGSVPDTVLRYWLTTVIKVPPSLYEIVGMGIEQTQQALLAGVVDGAAIREPTLTLVLEREPTAKLLALGTQMMPNQPGSVLAVPGDFIRRRPETVTKLVALHERATRLLQEQPDRAALHLQKGLGLGILPVGVFRRALHSPTSVFEADPGRIRAATAVMQAFQLELGVLTTPADLDRLFDGTFYQRAMIVQR